MKKFLLLLMGVLASTLPGWAALSSTDTSVPGQTTYKYNGFGNTTGLVENKTVTLEGSGVVVTLEGSDWANMSGNLVCGNYAGAYFAGNVIKLTAPEGFNIIEVANGFSSAVNNTSFTGFGTPEVSYTTTSSGLPSDMFKYVNITLKKAPVMKHETFESKQFGTDLGTVSPNPVKIGLFTFTLSGENGNPSDYWSIANGQLMSAINYQAKAGAILDIAAPEGYTIDKIIYGFNSANTTADASKGFVGLGTNHVVLTEATGGNSFKFFTIEYSYESSTKTADVTWDWSSNNLTLHTEDNDLRYIVWGKTYPLPVPTASENGTEITDGTFTWSVGKGGEACDLVLVNANGEPVGENDTPKYFRIIHPVFQAGITANGFRGGPDFLNVTWTKEGYDDVTLSQEFRLQVPSEKMDVKVVWIDEDPAKWGTLKYGEDYELPEFRAYVVDGADVNTIDVSEYGSFIVEDENYQSYYDKETNSLKANQTANGKANLKVTWRPNYDALPNPLGKDYDVTVINYYNYLNTSAPLTKEIAIERVYHNIVPVVDFGEGKTSIEIANFDKNIDLSEKFPYHAEGKDAVTEESLYNVSGTWEFSSADETLFTVEKGVKEVENPYGGGTTKVETWTLTPCEDKQGDTKLIAKFTPNAGQSYYEVKEYEFEIPVTVTPKQNAFAPEVKMTVDGGEYTVYVEGEDELGDTSMIPVDANYFVNKGSFDVTVRENSNGTKTLYTLDGSDPLEEGNSNVKELVATEGNGKIEFTGDDAVEVEDKYMGVPVRKVILTIANVSDEYEPSEVQTFEADYFAIQTLYNYEMTEYGYDDYVPTSADKAVNFEYIEAAGLYTGFLPYIEEFGGYLAEWGYSQYNLIPSSLSIKYALLPEGEDLDQTQGSDGTKKLLEIYDPEADEDENGFMMRYVDFSNKADGDLVLYVWAASESANGPALAQKVSITAPEAPEAPTFSVEDGGVVLHTGKLAIEVPEGVSVRYTLDGTEPTATEGAVYNDPITFGESYLDKLGNYTVKAIAYLTNYPASASEVVSTTFELKEDLSTTDIVGNLMFGQQMFSSEDPKVYSDRITMTEDPQIENGKIEAQMELKKPMNTLKGYEDEHEDVFVGAITLNGTEGAVGTATLKFEDKKVSKLYVTANSTSTHNTVLVVNGKEINVAAELGTSYEDGEGQIKYNLTYDMLKEKNTYDVEVEESPINEIVLSAKAGSPAVEVYAIAFEYTGYRADRPAVSVNEDNKVVIEMGEHSVEARYYFSSSELSDDTLKGLKYEDMTKYEAPFGFETGGYIYAVAYSEDNLPSNFTKFEYVANVAATLSVDEAYVAAGTAAKVKLSTGASLMNYKLILKDAEGEDADVTVSVADDGYANNRKVTFKNPGVYTVEATWEKGYGYSAGNAVLDGEITVYAPLDITKIAEKVNYKGTSINLVKVEELYEDFDLAKAINAGDAEADVWYRYVENEGDEEGGNGGVLFTTVEDLEDEGFILGEGTAFTPVVDFQEIEVYVVANNVVSPLYSFYYATEEGIEKNFRTELVLTCQVDESVKYEAKVDQVHIPVIGLADADEDNLPAFEYEILDSEGKTVAEDLYTLDKDKAPYDLYITFKEAGIYNLHISWEKNAQYQHGETTSAGITIYEAPHITDNDKGIKLNGSGLKFHSSGKGLVFAEGARDHKVTVEVPDEKTELWYRAIELKSGSEAAKAIRRAADAAADPDSDDTDLEGFQKLEGSELTLAGEHGTLEMFTKKNGVSSMIERVAYTNDATKILDILDGDINTGIEGVDADLEGAEYYDLNGYRVDGRELKAGIYVRVLNGESTKVIIR